MKIIPIPAFSDNYLWLIHDDCTAVVVDPGDAAPVSAFLAEHGLELRAILITHHHADHVGGVRELASSGMPVFGPAAEKIAGINRPLGDGDRFSIPELGLSFEVIEVPGHTRGHIAYFGQGRLFCGDTLFSAGCGRMFEGSAEQFHHSLMRLAALPAETTVHCAHEYTLANLAFACAAEPDNKDRDKHVAHCKKLRNDGVPTLPSTIGLELRINPFLRCAEPSVRASLDVPAGSSDVEVFAALREWKNRF